ncbi:MAG: hypothetical protein WCL08_13035 [Verrucomicrobiota bacterium]
MNAKWEMSAVGYAAGCAAITELDHEVMRMERKWGVGRLRTLLSPDLRKRFLNQQRKCDVAYRTGDVKDLKHECQRMINAWRAADRESCDAGYAPAGQDSWETVLADGTVVVLVKTDADATAYVKPKGRDVTVWSLAEVAKLIMAQEVTVRGIKGAVPSRVVAMWPVAPPGGQVDPAIPASAFDWAVGDDLDSIKW